MIKKLLPFIALVVTLISCEIDRQSLIIGRWTKIDIVNDTVPFIDAWAFDNTGDCYMIREVDGNQDTLIEGKYLVKNEVLTITGETNIPYFMGDWDINSIDENHMTVVLQAPGMEYFEFIKED